ncbi:ParA family protein [Enterococcus thailandicus]|uniref:ParA family protein n=1 Tax=Enterococcus TaxID=1350 RepID=UPI0022EC0048|nr:AAA family ATPase [Enterococcus thailandicus]MDA3965291.1 AAA family ATPase [Enterococcus thailandicus]
MSSTIISVLNMKGGVGKTTLSCNIAIELADRGNRVLVIDSDPQFNTTQTLFKFYTNSVDKYNELREEELTIKSIFNQNQRKSRLTREKERTEQSLIYSFPDVEKEWGIQKGLSLIPGDLSLIVDINAAGADRFKAFFFKEKLSENFDFIIIDCPPTWGELTSISLTISDYYLIPTKLDEFSTIGITILSELLSEKVAASEGNLKCLGVVYMMLNETTAENGIARRNRPFKEAIENYFPEMSEEVFSDVKEFQTVIYTKQSIATSSVVYKVYNDRYPELSERIKDLVDEIVGRLKLKEEENYGQ